MRTVLVVVAVLIVRTLRWAMVVDGDGITIRNTWRTRSWTWAEIGEIGRDQAGVFILPGKVIAVCPLGDPYTYKANATAAAGARFEQIVDRLRPYLEAHGVDDRTGDEVESVWRWPYDPRSRPDHEPRAPRRRRRVAPAAGTRRCPPSSGGHPVSPRGESNP